MRQDELSRQSMDFAVMIIDPVRTLKAKYDTVISDRIGHAIGTIPIGNLLAMLYILSPMTLRQVD